MSDHGLVYAHRKIAIPCKQPKIYTRQFKEYNIGANTLWKEWREKFLLVADMHAPPVTRRVRSEHAPWLTSEIKRKIYDRDFLKKKSVKSGSANF